DLERDVAIKVLRPTHLTNPEVVHRFLQEARATARIAHPGIVTIHDCGRVETSAGETAFIAMELLAGESLSARLARSGVFEPAAAIEIARQVASAIEAAHRADVLHRDLKPDNIYIVPDPAMPEGERIKVLDFGLAKLGTTDGHTETELVFGTPRYMSPEQCRSSAQVDHRSDIYALGCILFEMVTGAPPFDGDVRRLIEQHQRTTAPRASDHVDGVAPALDALIAEMLAKDPMSRPQTMGAVQRALAAALDAPNGDASRRSRARIATGVPLEQLAMAGEQIDEAPAWGPLFAIRPPRALSSILSSGLSSSLSPSAPSSLSPGAPSSLSPSAPPSLSPGAPSSSSPGAPSSSSPNAPSSLPVDVAGEIAPPREHPRPSSPRLATALPPPFPRARTASAPPAMVPMVPVAIDAAGSEPHAMIAPPPPAIPFAPPPIAFAPGAPSGELLVPAPLDALRVARSGAPQRATHTRRWRVAVLCVAIIALGAAAGWFLVT
ncbi:MAG TPA: serine/threonine-protein kinase, partial [Kofleriaceae bacterium]|nr:serine/threonine-protein kinase [Kofleriaceae bacterium]